MLDPKQGLYMLASQDIFEYLRRAECQQEQMNAYVSFYEIYQGQLYDLLNDRKKLHAREDGNQNVIIQGIEEFEVHTPEDLMDVFDRGSLERSTGSFEFIQDVELYIKAKRVQMTTLLDRMRFCKSPSRNRLVERRTS